MIRLRPIVPKLATPADYRRARSQALDKAAKRTRELFEETTATWRDKPTFSVEENGDAERIIGTDDEKYGWADDGTKPHDIGPIVPKTKQAITIRGKGTPKTAPRVIGSGSGSKGAVVAIRKSTKVIHHPGTEAREFSTVIADEAEQILAVELQRAIDGVG